MDFFSFQRNWNTVNLQHRLNRLLEMSLQKFGVLQTPVFLQMYLTLYVIRLAKQMHYVICKILENGKIFIIVLTIRFPDIYAMGNM